jgi:hypothetical protein
MALRHIGVLATALLVVGPTGLARAQPPCTAEQGQVLIDFELVTTELVPAPAILPGESLTVSLAPGRTVEIPVPASAGETIAVATSSHDYWDTIALLLAPDGTPVAGSDDANQYFAAFSWPAAETATYRLRVTFFEAVNSGLLLVKRK